METNLFSVLSQALIRRGDDMQDIARDLAQAFKQVVQEGTTTSHTEEYRRLTTEPPHLKIIAWNTHCKYTHHGQRIAFTLLEDGNIAFLDRDRGIDGRIPPPHASLVTKEYVHEQYLHNRYIAGLYEFPEVRQALWEACGKL